MFQVVLFPILVSKFHALMNTCLQYVCQHRALDWILGLARQHCLSIAPKSVVRYVVLSFVLWLSAVLYTCHFVVVVVVGIVLFCFCITVSRRIAWAVVNEITGVQVFQAKGKQESYLSLSLFM